MKSAKNKQFEITTHLDKLDNEFIAVVSDGKTMVRVTAKPIDSNEAINIQSCIGKETLNTNIDDISLLDLLIPEDKLDGKWDAYCFRKLITGDTEERGKRPLMEKWITITFDQEAGLAECSHTVGLIKDLRDHVKAMLKHIN